MSDSQMKTFDYVPESEEEKDYQDVLEGVEQYEAFRRQCDTHTDFRIEKGAAI